MTASIHNTFKNTNTYSQTLTIQETYDYSDRQIYLRYGKAYKYNNAVCNN
jgi:hypothetical protein